MGNSTVTRTAAAGVPYPRFTDTTTDTIPRTSVSIINPDILAATTKSPTPSIPVDHRTSVAAANPETFTSPTHLDHSAVTVKSPTPRISVNPRISAAVANPETSTSPNHLDHSAAATKLPTRRISVNPRTSVAAANPEFSTSPTHIDHSAAATKPPTRRTSVNPRTSVTAANPETSTSPNHLDHSAAATKPPTRRTSVNPRTSVTAANPETSTSPTHIHHSAVATKSPSPSIPVNHRISATVANPATITSPIHIDHSAVAFSTFGISAPRTIPVASSTFPFPVVSPTINDIPVKSSNLIPVLSPDSSAVSPTFDLPITPIASPTPIIPVNFTISPTEAHSAVRITDNTSAIRIAPLTPVISTTPLFTKVAPKRTASKISITSPTSPVEQTKSTTLSSVERWDKWDKFGQKHKKSFSTTGHSQSIDTSTPPPPSNTNHDQKVTFMIPDIIAVPSYLLRTTAVCNPPENDHISTERTQSIHTDISIFKYHLTQKETKHTIGNHTKATMFKMDTRLKQTPLPTPSLSFLTKNFNDGTHETDENSTTKPTFDSLGLENNLERESPGKFHSQQRKIVQTSSTSDLNSPSIGSLQFVTSTVFSQANFFPTEKPSGQNNRQPLTSILKKTSSQVIPNTFPVSTNSKGSHQEFRKSDYENYPSTVSFNIRRSSRNAQQSISRSEKLFSKRSFHRKNEIFYQ